jgi:S-adenosylmethionine:tRNA ribosyltransferase-isomerase
VSEPLPVEHFDYGLPPGAIAQTPVEPRDRARLLVDRGPRRPPDHRHVSDLASLLEPGDVLVVNDSRVRPARLDLQKPTGGRAEVLLLEPRAGRSWSALVRPGRRLRDGAVLGAGGEPVLVVGPAEADGRVVTFLGERPVEEVIDEVGTVPLPPYIRAGLEDPDRYQTVYARQPGSAAAPTAGLHLTDGVLDEVRARGVEVVTVELRVGLDTFQPLRGRSLDDQLMHTEAYRVPPDTAAAVADGARVVAVGTTTVRALESAALGPPAGRTDLFIRPGHDFAVVDVLLTNFHVPRSSLLVLLEAFMGARWRDLYRGALEGGYRFLSFGDAMLVERSGAAR